MWRSALAGFLLSVVSAQNVWDSTWIKFANMRCRTNEKRGAQEGDKTVLLATENNLDTAKSQCNLIGGEDEDIAAELGRDAGIGKRCNVIVDPDCSGSGELTLLDNCIRAAYHEGGCVYMRPGAWQGGSGVAIVGDGTQPDRPTASISSNPGQCAWGTTEQEDAALNLCLAAGFHGGNFIFSSGNPCSDSFTTGENKYNYHIPVKSNDPEAEEGEPDNDAALVAECHQYDPCQGLGNKLCGKVRYKPFGNPCKWNTKSGMCENRRGSCVTGVRIESKGDAENHCAQFDTRVECKRNGCEFVSKGDRKLRGEKRKRGCYSRGDAKFEDKDMYVTRCKRMGKDTCCKASGCVWNGAMSKCYGSFDGWDAGR